MCFFSVMLPAGALHLLQHGERKRGDVLGGALPVIRLKLYLRRNRGGGGGGGGGPVFALLTTGPGASCMYALAIVIT